MMEKGENMKKNEMLYEMIFKRKSFHIFKDIGYIAPEELEAIESLTESCLWITHRMTVSRCLWQSIR